MPSTFQLTEDTVRDLMQTMDHLSQHSIAAAIRLSDDLEQAFRFLAEWPNSGHRRAEFGDGPIRFWVVGAYLIAYLPETKPLLVLGVTHDSRDSSAEIDFRLHKP